MEDLAVLVGSCDKNEWLVELFFKFFKINWGDCPYKIYLSLERKQIDIPAVNILNDNGKDGWSGRIERALKKIDEQYILMMLDDFIIEEKVDQKRIERYVSRMKKDDIYNIILTEVPNELNEGICEYYDWVHRNRYGRYKTSLQCGIWKKTVLESLLEPNENAWEFEIYGNIRSFLYRNNFYALKNNHDKPIIYNDGFFVVQGKVNLNEKYRLEKKLQEEIVIDYSVSAFAKDIIRDDIKFISRIFRRIKIMVMYSKYRLMGMFGIKNENRIYDTK